MKRDMDLVRKILLACEAEPSGWAPSPLVVEGYTEAQIGFHVMLMAEAGLIQGKNITSSKSQGPQWLPGPMTWAGYEFLDASRDEGTWGKAKAAVSKVGGFSFDVLKAILVKYMAEQAGQLMRP